jgi:hypothetical protein
MTRNVSGPASKFGPPESAEWEAYLQGDYRHSPCSEVRPTAKALDPKNSDDYLRGAREIAEFFFGDPRKTRQVYHWVATSRLPVFRPGSMIWARKSVLLKFMSDQEQRGNPQSEDDEKES